MKSLFFLLRIHFSNLGNFPVAVECFHLFLHLAILLPNRLLSLHTHLLCFYLLYHWIVSPAFGVMGIKSFMTFTLHVWLALSITSKQVDLEPWKLTQKSRSQCTTFYCRKWECWIVDTKGIARRIDMKFGGGDNFVPIIPMLFRVSWWIDVIICMVKVRFNFSCYVNQKKL